MKLEQSDHLFSFAKDWKQGECVRCQHLTIATAKMFLQVKKYVSWHQ